jgi:WD40 repeat protein
VFTGHGRIVTDVDFHPNFTPFSKELCLLSCSADTTLRLWNSFNETSKFVVRGHAQVIIVLLLYFFLLPPTFFCCLILFFC